MTTNVFDDNLALWAASLNALANADAGEAIESGCSVSKGSGDWDSDVTAGTIRLGGVSVSVSADTVTHSDSSGLGTDEARVDLITADSAGALSITEGAGAANPASPDIPADEVVVGFWIISDTDTTLADSDLFDVPGLFYNQSDPIYGDGSDGAITRSANGNENGLINATTYTLESGVTRTVSNGYLILRALQSITIEGTLDASGQGGAGGGPSSNGENGIIAPIGTGGAGGAGETANGGDGGDGDTRSTLQLRDIAHYDLGVLLEELNTETNAGAGGGGGATSNDGTSDGSGNDGTAPGGGGGNMGDLTDNGLAAATGGDGGDGGGLIVLIAPVVTVSGTVDASATDGQNGQSQSGGGITIVGGGGGGGSGGIVVIMAGEYTETGTVSVAKGTGGNGGSGTAGNSGDGADGEDGAIKKVLGS